MSGPTLAETDVSFSPRCKVTAISGVNPDLDILNSRGMTGGSQGGQTIPPPATGVAPSGSIKEGAIKGSGHTKANIPPLKGDFSSALPSGVPGKWPAAFGLRSEPGSGSGSGSGHHRSGVAGLFDPPRRPNEGRPAACPAPHVDQSGAIIIDDSDDDNSDGDCRPRPGDRSCTAAAGAAENRPSTSGRPPLAPIQMSQSSLLNGNLPLSSVHQLQQQQQRQQQQQHRPSGSTGTACTAAMGSGGGSEGATACSSRGGGG